MSKKTTIKKAATKKTAKKQIKTPSSKKLFGPDVYKRDGHGLLECVNYIFNEDGSVNWRAMIKPEFLYPNKGWFDMRGQQVPSSTEGLRDNQLLIMLGGIKDLARLRGFHTVGYDARNVEDGYVTARCNIEWIGNYESSNNNVCYEDYANASLENTDAFCEKFLETIACNRAFVRCVRNFLNIHIVGADEIDKSGNRSSADQKSSTPSPSSSAPITPSGLLEKTLRDKHSVDSFDSFKEKLRDFWKDGKYLNEEVKNWSSFSDIPAKEARKLIGILAK
tara:strand:- start:146 stop:979 length:834 start_codon:yes stop_codon:yes gene_type:complete